MLVVHLCSARLSSLNYYVLMTLPLVVVFSLLRMHLHRVRHNFFKPSVLHACPAFSNPPISCPGFFYILQFHVVLFWSFILMLFIFIHRLPSNTKPFCAIRYFHT